MPSPEEPKISFVVVMLFLMVGALVFWELISFILEIVETLMGWE